MDSTFCHRIGFARERGRVEREWDRDRDTERETNTRIQITQQKGTSYYKVLYVQNGVLFSPSKNKPVTFCISVFCISPGHMYLCNVQSPEAHRAEWELTAAWSRSPELRSTPVREAAARFKEEESTEPWEGTLNPTSSVSYWLNLLCIHIGSRKSLTLILCLLQKKEGYRLRVNTTKHHKRNKHLHAFSLLGFLSPKK